MPFDPDQSLGFLVSDIARLLREQFNSTAQTLGLTLAQGRALLQLARNQGISQVALAQLLEIQPITLLRQIDRLADAGLVERRVNPNDRRAQRLYLTPKAEALLAEIVRLGESLTELAMAGLSDAERRKLFKLLGRIKSNLASAGASPSDSRSGDVPQA